MFGRSSILVCFLSITRLKKAQAGSQEFLNGIINGIICSSQSSVYISKMGVKPCRRRGSRISLPHLCVCNNGVLPLEERSSRIAWIVCIAPFFLLLKDRSERDVEGQDMRPLPSYVSLPLLPA